LEWNGTHQHLACADVVFMLGENINTIRNNIESLLQAGREIGLEVNTEKIKFMVVSCHQKAG
jgi:hypothetical protein